MFKKLSRQLILHYLIATDDVDNNKEVSNGNEPPRLLQGYEDIVLNFVSKNQVTNEGNGEVAQGHNSIGNQDTFPHGLLGGLFGCGRDCCLDLQNHIVACKGKGHISQRTQEVENVSRCCGCPVAVLHIWGYSFVEGSSPTNSGIAAKQDKINK